MTERPLEHLRDHEYDGIQEYDNPTPGWWTGIFVLTVIFSVLYFPYYHGTLPGRTMHAAYDASVAENLRLQFAEIGELAPDEPTLLRFMQPAQAEWLKVGDVVFKAQCQGCHGSEGQGGAGPNLTDDHYKNVRRLADIPLVIANGAANGMPAWKTRLHPNEIVLVSAYVARMRGRNLASSRPPEGEIIAPWPAAAPESKPATDATTD
ncbi:MAG: c-type cytochrome [Phycisphaerales bacterium]|nr:c-type cytochrome [Phycisphaerales bacterium]